jgi:hypothetical protein
MKFLFILTILVLVALSFYADYRWKQWVESRKQARSMDQDRRS